MQTSDRTIEQERQAFEARLPELLKEHEGRIALFFGGELVGVYDTDAQAYDAGLGRFGLDATFLVAPILADDPAPVSIAWTAGVMFG